MINESLPLYYRSGSAEHLYQPSLEARQGGYVVNVTQGVRGSPLQTGTKTPVPVTYEHAKRIYAGLVTSKMAKGYAAEAPGPIREAVAVSVSRLRPMAPQPITMEQAVRLIPDPNWWLQELFGGQHLLIRKTKEAIEGIDAAGAVVPLPPAIVEAAARIRFRWVMEGVLDGAEFTAFDLAQFATLDFRTLDYSTRWAGLRQLGFPVSRHLRIAETAVEVGVKAEFLQRLRAGGKPGFVLKKSNGTCRPGCSGCEDNLLQCHFERSVRSSPSAETSSMTG